MYDLFAIGDIKLDTFVLLDPGSVQLKMPECLLCFDYGAKVDVKVVDSQVAGSAPNVATGLARLGFKTGMVSNMGGDGTREMALKHLAEENVSTKFINVTKGEASSYSVVLMYKGDRTILTSHIQHAYRFPKNLPKSPWLYIGEIGEGYENLYRSLEAHARKFGTKIGLNPGSVQLKELRPHLFDLIRQTEILFVNKEEAQLLAHLTSGEVNHLAPALFKLGCKHVVITDGHNGAFHFDGKTLSFCPIYPGKKISATGAGDSFATGFMAALMKGLAPEEGMRWGSVNSASVIGKIGPTEGLLALEEIRKRLRRMPTFKTQKM